ncbi:MULTISPECIES: phosphatidate cytidylyltransferase [unclassified Acinetobacter]|uniref:phosphatidate cytidylyltransferase n=1 Tax=unclassified Acinetobacter TaxID=196816 RepID=UPI0035BB4CC2
MLERIITAIVLVAVVLSCMFATTSIYPMLVLMVLAALGAGYEWYKLMPQKAEMSDDVIPDDVQDNAQSQSAENKKRAPSKAIAWAMGLGCAVVAWASITYLKDLWILFWFASIMVWLVSIYWVKRYPEYDGWYNGFLPIIGLILIVAAITAIFSLWHLSPWWLMYAFLLVWGADSGAYFVGRKFGMRKLAPSVSPNKSIEGLIGGLVTSSMIIVMASIFWLDLKGIAFVAFLILSLITVLASVLGDLVESMIKRRADVKDSGRIFPGHGGVLDRVDSLLAAAPVFAAGLYVLKLMGHSV